MNWKEYQKAAMAFKRYPQERAREYAAYGLIGEVGEVASLFAKRARGDTFAPGEWEEKLAKELGDCLWLLAACLDAVGVCYEVKFCAEFGPQLTSPLTLSSRANSVAFEVSMIVAKPSMHYAAAPLVNCILSIAREIGHDFDDLATANLAKLQDRADRNVIKGSGDNR